MTLAEPLAALYARAPLGMRLGLDGMRDACARAGHPERACEVVHIAGTNGKGSTSAMVESIARASGRRTGLYTSPHLVRFAERIRLDGQMLADDALARALTDALRIGPELSFFEAATLAGFLAFREAGVDLVVLEVGIGGRLDATNVIEAPSCTAITNIALDHQDKLGDTLAAIAREKASIGKAGVPMVLGSGLPPPALEAARERLDEIGARIVHAEALPQDVALALEGEHQRRNAAVAWGIGSILGVGDDARRRGLAEARWAGRIERIATPSGTFILDGAHNPDGARALVDALAGQEIGAVVFGALADKAYAETLAEIARVDAPRVYVEAPGRAAAPPRELAGVCAGLEVGSIVEALGVSRELARERPVVVCGSLYLVGAVRGVLLGLESDPNVGL